MVGYENFIFDYFKGVQSRRCFSLGKRSYFVFILGLRKELFYYIKDFDHILSCHCERSEAISLNRSGFTLGNDKITTSFYSS